MLRPALALLLVVFSAVSVVSPIGGSAATARPGVAQPAAEAGTARPGAASTAPTDAAEGHGAGSAASPADSGFATTEHPLAAGARPTVLINELSNTADKTAFFELRNWGTSSVDLSGWHVYRCSPLGLRSNLGRLEAELSGVVLKPGEIFTVSSTGMPGDAHFTQSYSESGFGIYLEGPSRRLVDAVGVYPNEPWPTTSECTVGRNLPNVLASAFGESWQRVAATGSASDFVVTTATPGSARTQRTASAPENVAIDELATGGPRSARDEFVELVNDGRSAVDLSGWRVYKCTSTGRLTDSELELVVEQGTTLEPGERWVAAGEDFTGDADARLTIGLADLASGIRVHNAAGQLVDRVAVSPYGDSACQGPGAKLAAHADFVADESYQRINGQLGIARRTPGAPNRVATSSVFAESFAYSSRGIAISEFATDPSGVEGVRQQNFIEIGNYGNEAVDVGGWTIRRCEASGARSRDAPIRIAHGTTLAPGDTWLAARSGTALAPSADTEFDAAFNFLGAGAWLADTEGQRRDSIGVYAANEMDDDNVTQSPCTKGVALTTYQPDRLLGQTFQRSRFTGVDADDFDVAVATPGAIDELPWRAVAAAVVPEAPVERAVERAVAVGDPVVAASAWAGVSEGPLRTLEGRRESDVDARNPGVMSDSAWGHPYQRFELRGLAEGETVEWQGSATERNEVQFSVWNGRSWRLLDAGIGLLSGTLEKGEVTDGVTFVLAQAGPRSKATLAAKPDGELDDPDAYDLAISHITDTQYLTETYPLVYADLVNWIATNAPERKIAFATHTGDLVQNWVDPAQNDIRARREFERASEIQAILDVAGVPNSVLPGNHDNKRGASNALFNEYFGPERYEDAPTYAGSIAPGDNSANFSTFEQGGAAFLMLSLPYAYGEREIAWAEEVVTSHPDHNVILSTHEHVTPKTSTESAHRSANSRWVSRGKELWERVIAPNRNVGIVLSGHFHGIGKIVTENAGDIEGHTVVELLADYQEFRTHSGERATGFQRLLQIDLASSTVAVDTFSVRLDASSSFEFDYPQFVPDSGLASSRSNYRPWNIVGAGLQNRYAAADDEFHATVQFQYDKSVATEGLFVTRAAVPQAFMEPRMSAWL